MKSIALQLKDTMEKRGISREELATITGISEDILLTIEADSTEVTISELIKISSALNVSFQIGDTKI